MAVIRRFKQVDVFTQLACKGNPLAVVLDAEGLSETEMFALARWTNLSETTFVLPASSPQADYRVRIFTPGAEFPFAGHPTLGTAHALLEAGLRPKAPGRLVQECGVGLVPVSIGADHALAFKAPPAQLRALHPSLLRTVEAALQSTAFCHDPAPLIATAGISWLVVRMHSAADCLAVRPNAESLAELTRLGLTGIALYGAHAPGGPADYEVRAIFSKLGVMTEDPVTGSANACIAQALQAGGLAPQVLARGYSVRQGTLLDCDGRVAVSFPDGAPWVGGHSVTVIDGSIRF